MLLTNQELGLGEGPWKCGKASDDRQGRLKVRETDRKGYDIREVEEGYPKL